MKAKSIRTNFHPDSRLKRFLLLPIRRKRWLDRICEPLAMASNRVRAGRYRDGTETEKAEYRRVLGWCSRFFNVQHRRPAYAPIDYKESLRLTT